MRILITGGTGLIGQPLAASLASDGHEPIVLTRNPAAHRGTQPGVRFEAWDGRTAEGWGQLVEGAGAVINLAGESIAGEGFPPDRWTGAKKQRILQSRLDVAGAVVQAVQAAASKPRVLIQASAVGYYGPRGDERVTEESAPGSDFLANVCRQWEAATQPAAEAGVRQVIIRTGLVLSTEGGPLPQILLPFRLFAGGPLGSGRQYWPWIHIDDEIRAIRFLLENEKASGPYNLTAPEPVTNAEFSRTLGRVLKRPSFMPAPAFALRLVLWEAATIVLDGQRALPQGLEKLGFTFNHAHLEAALRQLLQS